MLRDRYSEVLEVREWRGRGRGTSRRRDSGREGGKEGRERLSSPSLLLLPFPLLRTNRFLRVPDSFDQKVMDLSGEEIDGVSPTFTAEVVEQRE